MKLLEEYQEFIERDAAEISCLWKYVQMFVYLLCTISGYACSVLFYVLKEQIFGGNCPLWATCILKSKDELQLNDTLDAYTIISNWWKYVIINYKHGLKCKIYLITCFSSSAFGIVWFTLFLMCGKGGHDISIYDSPWRIVFPAMLFNFVFTIISIFAHYNLEEGYKTFTKSIIDVSSEIYDTCQIVVDLSECEITKIYMKMYNFHVYNMCEIMSYLKILSVVMLCSWVAGLIILILRMVVFNDFRILKIRIYEVKEE